MTQTKQSKEYKAPQFQLVRQDEQNKVFFTASGAPAAPSVGGSLGSMTSDTGGWV